MRVTQAKLLTGEIITIAATSEDPNAYADLSDVYEYVGPGNYYSPDNSEKDFRVYHFWIEKKNYYLKNLRRGDKILIYVNIAPDGSGKSMGPSVYGKRENLTWAVFGGMIGATSAANAYLQDGRPIGIPISNTDIVCVEYGTGIDVIKGIMCKYAIEIGGFHLKNYVDEFKEVPFKKGDYVKPGYDYSKENTKLGVRNSHKVLQSDDLVYDSWVPGHDYLAVKSIGLNKTAFLAITSVNLKQMV